MVTINDVAEAAGVSISTVSRVMNQSTTVSKETYHRVMEVVRRLEYVPNVSAKKHSSKSTKLIGVLFPDISNNIFGRIMQGINNVVTSLGYNLIICETNGNLEKEIHFLNVLKDKQVDGVIMANIHIPEDHMMWVRKKHIPIVYVCQAGKKRYEGYMEGMHECHLTIRQDMMAFEEAFTIEDGYHGMKQIYETSALLPTTVICASDNMAIGAIGFLYDNNIQVPQQISITGVDDTNLAGAIRPSLTTIRHATPDTGVKAAQLLLEYIADPDFSGGSFNTPYKILRRQSVRQIL